MCREYEIVKKWYNHIPNPVSTGGSCTWEGLGAVACSCNPATWRPGAADVYSKTDLFPTNLGVNDVDPGICSFCSEIRPDVWIHRSIFGNMRSQAERTRGDSRPSTDRLVFGNLRFQQAIRKRGIASRTNRSPQRKEARDDDGNGSGGRRRRMLRRWIFEAQKRRRRIHR